MLSSVNTNNEQETGYQWTSVWRTTEDHLRERGFNLPGKLQYKNDGGALPTLKVSEKKWVLVPLRVFSLKISTARASVVPLGHWAEKIWQEINCFKIDSPTRGEKNLRNVHKAGKLVPLKGSFQNFRRAAPYLVYGSPPSASKSHRGYIGFGFFRLSIGSCFPR